MKSGKGYSREERIDLELFDYIRKSGDGFSDEEIFRRLYKSKNRNAYYRLRNRLLTDINKSLLLQHYEYEERVLSLHMLALARFYFNRNQRLANYYLKRAEAAAGKGDNLELLDIIYGEFIRLSHESLEIDPAEYVLRRKENREKIEDLRAIDDILAMVSYRMKMSQNFSSDRNPVLPLLERIVNDYTNDKSILKNPMLRFRIYHAVTQILLQKRDYPALEHYLLATYKDFSKEKLFNRSNHDTKLQMLVYLINSLFKNNKLKESLEFTEVLKEGMKEFQNVLHDKFLFYYYNSLVINYSRLNRTKAIEYLNEMKSNEKIQANPFHQMFVYLNLAVTYFDSRDFHSSVRNLTRLYISDAYAKADISLKFKIAIAELMIRYELSDFDVLETKIRQLKKDYREFFTSEANRKEALIVEVINTLIEREGIKQGSQLMNRIKKYILSPGQKDGSDAEILNYSNWLNDKLRLSS